MYLKKIITRLLNGINQSLAGNGTKNIGIIACGQNQIKLNAANVQMNLFQWLQIKNTVQNDVKTGPCQELSGQIINQKNNQLVNIADKFLNHYLIILENIAANYVIRHRERVYDITIDRTHIYSANGVLVHNCSDSVDYLLCSMFKQFYKE